MVSRQLTYCFLLLTIWLYSSPSVLFAQNTSNKGRDFWLGYGNHVRGFSNNTQQMVVYITSDINTTGVVEIPGLSVSIPFTITANQVTSVNIPQNAYLKDDGKYNLGIHVSAEKPVVVYAHIYDQSVSGATLVLPTNTLGKDYYSINYSQISNDEDSYSYFFVVAVDDDTEVEITPSQDTKGGWSANSTHIVRLNKGEIYQVLGVSTTKEYVGTMNDRPLYKYGGVDLTGSRIKSISTTLSTCKKIAVFSGSGKVSIGCDDSKLLTSDNLYQQVYPTATWGKRFVTVPLESRNYDIFRILRSDLSATVKLNGTVVNNSQFRNNLYYEFASQGTNYIESDKPIQVVQYAVTQGKSMNCSVFSETRGDPEMIFLNPLDQVLKKITMYSTGRFNISSHFINVVISNEGVESFRLDGADVSGQFQTVNTLRGYSYAKLIVEPGTHTLSSRIGFNAIAYGFGPQESYGYAAGANLDFQSVEAISKVNRKPTSVGCIGESFDFKINLPYQTPKLVWDLDNGTPPLEQNFTAPDSTFLKDNQMFYVYKLNQTITYNEAKAYKVNVQVTTTTDNGCGAFEDIIFNFDVYNPPDAKFDVLSSACLNEPVTFKDLSDGNGRDVTSWLWDFGDGKKSTEQNPSHVYLSTGKKNVTLTITNETNCEPSTSSVHEIDVQTIPSANFILSKPYCTGTKISFTDISVSTVGTIVKWYWDFGDGILSDLQNPEHTYTTAGDYVVKLRVENESGCQSSEKILQIKVGAIPVVDFQMPEFCLNDRTAKFVNNSFNADGTTTLLKYEWDFFDPLQNSHRQLTTRDASVLYTRADSNYVVTLTVTSGDGCPQVLSKKFTVNGSKPLADFTIVNSAVCSGQTIEFQDKASVDFGEITKIEWYYDFNNNPTEVEIDESPGSRQAPKVYTHTYPLFHTPSNKPIIVKMVVYSGESCASPTTKNITINAVPEADFALLPDACRNDNPFKLIQGKELNNAAGSGTYTGPGVNSSTSIFDPSIAGVGQHTIVYTFTSSAGCSDTISQTINVYENPVVRNESIEVLEGEDYKLPAITDNGLIYQWDNTSTMKDATSLQPVINPTDDIVYTLIATNSNNCSSTGKITVKVNKIPKIPNTFTPNGDNINDSWNILNLDTYPECTVDIFTRNGKKIFYSKGYTSANAWDGKFNGADVPVGTYYYIIDPKKGRKPVSGSVTVLR